MKELTLSKLYFKNYRNLIAEDGLKLNNLNICIGPNGSGKSNMIAILQFFREYLRSAAFSSDEIIGFEEAIQKLGGSDILDKTVESPAVVQFKMEFDPNDDIPNSIVYELEIIIKGFFEDIIIKRDSLPAVNPGQIIFAVHKWHFYNANNMSLETIRTSEPKIGKSDIFLAPSGENLALVFENLTRYDIDFEERINLAMRQILPKTRKIRAIRSGRLSLIIEWYFNDMKQPFYLNEISDGTVRMLCWAVILHSPDLPSLLVIDEPEIGIHPAWMSILADWIKAASHKTQIIISTHSSDLLDHFTDCLENVLRFDYDGKNHYHIRRLSRERLAPSLEQGWQLGDLYRVGDPEVGGWPW